MKDLCKSRIRSSLLIFQLKRFKVLIAVFTALFMATFPIPLLLRSTDIYSQISENTMPATIIFLLLVVVVIAIITPYMYFNYLFSKNSIDTFHSLPIKRRDLYITNLLSSIITVLIPFTIAYVLGIIVGSLRLNLILSSFYLLSYIRMVVIITSIIIITIYIIMNTGTLSDSIIYTGILFVLPFIAFVAIQFFANSYIVGYQFNSVEYLSLISPHYALFEIVTTYSENYRPDVISSVWFLLSVGIAAFSVNLYKTRPSEKTEEPFTNRYFFTFVSSLFTGIFLIFVTSIWSSFSNSSNLLAINNLIIPVLISCIAYFILNIIKNRSTRGSLQTLRNFSIVTVLTFALCYGYVFTGGLGYIDRIPDKEDINNIVLNVDSFYEVPITPQQGGKLVIDDPENIDTFRSLHKSILDAYRNDDTSVLLNNNSFLGYNYNDYSNFEFTYHLNEKSSISRSYMVRKDLIRSLAKIGYSKKQMIKMPLFNPDYKVDTVTVFNGTLTKKLDFKGQNKELAIHYLKDLQNIQGDTLLSSPSPIVYTIFYNSYKINDRYPAQSYSSLAIDERMTETIQYLESNSSQLSTVSDFLYYAIDYQDLGFDSVSFDYGLFFPTNSSVFYDIAKTRSKVSPEFVQGLQDKTCAYCYHDLGEKDQKLSYIVVDTQFSDNFFTNFVLIPFIDN